MKTTNPVMDKKRESYLRCQSVLIKRKLILWFHVSLVEAEVTVQAWINV